MTINETDELRIELMRIDGHGWALYTPTANYYLFHQINPTAAPTQPGWECVNCSLDLRSRTLPDGLCPSCRLSTTELEQ